MVETHMATKAMQSILKSIFDALQLAGSDVCFVTGEWTLSKSGLYIAGWLDSPVGVFNAGYNIHEWEGKWKGIGTIEFSETFPSSTWELNELMSKSDESKWIYPTPQEEIK